MLTKESRNELKVAMKSALVDQANMLTEGSEFVKEFVLKEATYEQLLNLCFNEQRDEGVYMEAEDLETLAVSLLNPVQEDSGKVGPQYGRIQGLWNRVKTELKGEGRQFIKMLNPLNYGYDLAMAIINTAKALSRIGTGANAEFKKDMMDLSRKVSQGQIKTGKEFNNAKNAIFKKHNFKTMKTLEQAIMWETASQMEMLEEGETWDKVKNVAKAGVKKTGEYATKAGKMAGGAVKTAGEKIGGAKDLGGKAKVMMAKSKARQKAGKALSKAGQAMAKNAKTTAAVGAGAAGVAAGLAYKKSRANDKTKKESALIAAKVADHFMCESVRDLWIARAKAFDTK